MSSAGFNQLPLGLGDALANDGLCVQRTDILFSDVAPGRVAIEVKVSNLGHRPTTPTVAVLRAATLGAFVDWRPLATLPVPVLGPGETFVLRTEAGRPAPQPLGWPPAVTPDQLLAAGDLDPPRPRPAPGPRPMSRVPMPFLPPDLNDLVGRGNLYWAGNIDVFVGNKSVERHLARALRVYPGHVNLATFFVGGRGRGRKPEAYRFHLVSTGEDWKATLHDLSGGPSLVLDADREPAVKEDVWVETSGPRVMTVALRPPTECGAGSVEVHITRRSDGHKAVVEFSLAADAAGPGCYAV
jgi:hypothetical protein